MKQVLDQTVVKDLLSYNQQTGVFTWNVTLNGNAKKGEVAGCVTSKGYVNVSILGRQYKAHRVAWLYVYGAWPTGLIDHIDGKRSNNAILNLRDVTQKINSQNIKLHQKRNKSGFLGVVKNRSVWQAKIVANGERFYLGVFGTPEEAHSAYIQAKRALHQGNTL